jgi:hypothetical protein
LQAATFPRQCHQSKSIRFNASAVAAFNFAANVTARKSLKFCAGIALAARPIGGCEQGERSMLVRQHQALSAPGLRSKMEIKVTSAAPRLPLKENAMSVPGAFGLFLVLSLAWLSVPCHADSTLYYTSSPQANAGAGRTVILNITPGSGWNINVAVNSPTTHNYLSFSINNSPALLPDRRAYVLNFEAPFQNPLVPGSYLGAVKADGPNNSSSPGLFFWPVYSGGFDSSLTGQFTVLDAEFSTTGSLLSFAVDFIQYDSGIAAQWNAGSLRINSDIPITLVSEPATSTLLVLGACVVAARARRALA